MNIVFLGLSITSSWGNGHATNYRALVRELARRGHDVLFLERDVPWYADRRDLAAPLWGRTALYRSLDDLAAFGRDVRSADVVVLGSYVPEGVAVGEWVLSTARGATAFYDIDTPVTLAKLEAGDDEYVSLDQLPRFDLYLSFTGGPILERLRELGVRRPVAFHCLVDPELYAPAVRRERWALGYLGTYSADRQPLVEELLVRTALELPGERFVVAGAQYPSRLRWPANVERIEHLPPGQHAEFYAAQRATLNVTRLEMRRWGWSPSVRLFEAAACAVPVVSDRWAGLERFFEPAWEIFVASSAEDVVRLLRGLTPERRDAVGARARGRVLAAHTASHRAAELEQHVAELARALAA